MHKEAIVVGNSREVPVGYTVIASLTWLDRAARTTMLVAFPKSGLEELSVEARAAGIAGAIARAFREGIASGRIKEFRTPLVTY